MKHIEDGENMQFAKASPAINMQLGWIKVALKVDQGFPGVMQLLKTGVGIC